MINGKRVLVLTVLLSFAVVPLWTARVTAQTDRARQVGMHLKCMCKGCDMSAGGCSHPGGAFSGPCETAKGMLRDVDTHIAKGETDEKIIQAFVAQYGTIVYMEPPKTGFGLVAWLMPVGYTVIGLGLVAFFVRKWSRRSAPVVNAHAGSSTLGVPTGNSLVTSSGQKISAEALERARAQADRETED